MAGTLRDMVREGIPPEAFGFGRGSSGKREQSDGPANTVREDGPPLSKRKTMDDKI